MACYARSAKHARVSHMPHLGSIPRSPNMLQHPPNAPGNQAAGSAAGACAPTTSLAASRAARGAQVMCAAARPYQQPRKQPAEPQACAAPPACVAAAHASLRSMTFSQVNTSVGSRPKCPYAAVFLYRGRYRSRLRPIMPASAAAKCQQRAGARCVIKATTTTPAKLPRSAPCQASARGSGHSCRVASCPLVDGLQPAISVRTEAAKG